jgi:hypothetical protein
MIRRSSPRGQGTIAGVGRNILRPFFMMINTQEITFLEGRRQGAGRAAGSDL